MLQLPSRRGLRVLALIAALGISSTLASAQVSGGPRSNRKVAPSLTTNLPNHPPGTLAILAGAGFLPNELVGLHILRADGTLPQGEGFDPWTVVATDSGTFVTSWLVSSNEVGTTLLATAHGQSSGKGSSTHFSNNHDCGTGVVVSVTPVGGACSAFTPAVGNGPDNYEVQEGATYIMTIAGVTECTGDTITVFVQSSSSGNFCFNAVGGSGTYAGMFTMPSPACNTMPVSYKCGADATCNHPGSLGASGPNSGCGGVHLRTSTFDGSCNWTGEDEDCSPPPATGACCLADGSCVEVTEAECGTLGGTYQGDGTACATTNCNPPPTGACCLPDDTCVEVTESECGTQGGIYQGDGSACASTNCIPPPLTGACCLPDYSCVEVTESECGTLGGIYQGGSTACATTNCNPPPDTGACCLPDFSCVEITESECANLGGTYQGDDTACATTNCLPPPATGACCLPDETCVEVTQADCQSMGGTYFGDGVTCDLTNCEPTIVVGACCLPDYTCVQVTPEDCAAQGGSYQGDGIACESVDCGPDCYMLTFDNDDDGNPMPHGAKIDAEFDCNGSTYPIMIAGSANPSLANTAAILDSTNGPATQDPDLLVGKGNILILQHDGNQTECPPASGVYCSHNDDANGGTLTFDFCVPVMPSSIVLVDIDGTDPSSSVVLTDVNGKTRTYSVPGNWTGDRVANFPEPGWKTLSLTTLANQAGFASTVTASQMADFDPNAVVKIVVTLGGSGAVDDLFWCQ